MKKLFRTKWLVLALCLCAPMTTWAEAEVASGTLDMDGYTLVSNSNASYGGTITLSEEKTSATVEFTAGKENEYTSEWGAGWQNTTFWNVSGCTEIKVSYSSLNPTTATIQLYVGDSKGYAGIVSGTTGEDGSGTIDYVIASVQSGYTSGYSYGTIDYENIEYLLIKANGACSATINSVEFVTSSNSGSGEGGEGDNGNTEDDSTYDARWDLSTEDADFTGLSANEYSSIYKIKGDGTDSGKTNTLIFPDGMSGTYWVALHNVIINTEGRPTAGGSKGMSRVRANRYSDSDASVENCGIYIPESSSENPLVITGVRDKKMPKNGSALAGCIQTEICAPSFKTGRFDVIPLIISRFAC